MNDVIIDLGIADETSLMLVLLLPITAGMLISQTNPYHALVIRGIVGAIAALVYALFGGADVALTEAFVGTMLSMMLYVVAVRSSMTMRVGCLQTLDLDQDTSESLYNTLLQHFKTQLQPHHLRVEVIPYETTQTLEEAMTRQEIHTMITPTEPTVDSIFQVQTRLKQLYDLINHPSITAIAPVSLYQPKTTPKGDS